LGITDILSISDPDSEALEDARLRWDFFQTKRALDTLHGISLLLHKGMTREICEQCGIPMSRGFWLENPASFSDDIYKLNGLVVVKPVNRWSTEGIEYCRPENLSQHMKSWRGPAVLEEFWSGEEVSVEVVCVRDTTSVIGWAVKGPTSPTSAPLLRLRYAGDKDAPPMLADAAHAIADKVHYEGIMEVEFIVASTGQWVLTEVNPRPSGVTPLLARSLGYSSVAVAVSMFYGAPWVGSRAYHACDFTLQDDEVMVSIRPLLDKELEIHPSVDGYPPRCYLTARSYDTLLRRTLQIEQATGIPLANQLQDRKKAYETIAHM
jgi:hypothetical protein